MLIVVTGYVDSVPLAYVSVKETILPDECPIFLLYSKISNPSILDSENVKDYNFASSEN